MSTFTHTISHDFWNSVDNNEEFYKCFTTFKNAIIRYLSSYKNLFTSYKVILITPCIGQYERRALGNFNGNPGYKATNAGIRNFKNNFAVKIEINLSEL
jgi:hypothetical protein